VKGRTSPLLLNSGEGSDRRRQRALRQASCGAERVERHDRVVVVAVASKGFVLRFYQSR
jgi:hypothetical protein